MNIRGIILVIVIIIVLYFLFSYFTRKTTQLSSFKSAKESKIVKANQLPLNTTSHNYTHSIWFNVNDWKYRLSTPKVLLQRGTPNSNPKITLAAYENNINIQVSTHPVSQTSNSNESTDFDCIIRNFPLQKWVNLIVSLNGRTLDAYLDGKLVRTCVLPGVPNTNADSDVSITPDGGFSGSTTNLVYLTHAVNPQEAYNIYKKGPGGGGVGSLFEKYKIKVSYLVNNTEKGSITT